MTSVLHVRGPVYEKLKQYLESSKEIIKHKAQEQLGQISPGFLKSCENVGLKRNNKVARDAAVRAAVIATGPFFISIRAAIVAEGYTISQLAKESVELGYLEKDGFVTRTLNVVGDSFIGEYAIF
ncbi:hypothetical protein C2G38_2200362 [Gigaspora rosea]|uniref:Uncharacterized protein n=1 Tax=Gigaspora rosea TaxID=44941 RepID=A0A397UYD9_9GLOM|nr:hypothetical protein C2G38_2200362 [Gigaspora rosea]